jgi:hypothetical protein
VFADALGWELAQKRQFMPDLFPYRQRCDTLFGYSCTCDPSILTGRLPHEHGHFSFFVKAQSKSPFGWARAWGWLPEVLAGHHRVRNKISRWVAQRGGYTGYFQLYSVPFSRLPWLDYTEKKDIYEPGGILGGQPAIFQEWQASGKKWMRSDWRKSDAENVAHLQAALRQGEVELAYLFTSGLDAVMHAHTTHGPAVDAAFARFEQWLREIYAIASEKYETVNIQVFSDHGMTDTKECSRMMPDFESLGLRYGTDYVAVWDSTMARFWFPGGEAIRTRVENWLAARTEGRIVSREELEKWGCWFEDGRYGEVFYLLNNGVIFAPSFMNQRRVPAMHGYDPDEPDSAACFLSTTQVERPPARIEQIHRLMQEAAR